MAIRNTGCCGIKEIENICDYDKDNLKILQTVCDTRIDNDSYPPFYFFSDVHSDESDEYEYGRSLVRYLKKHELGQVIRTIPIKENPNSGNNLKMWVWIVDVRNLQKWWQENKTDDWNGTEDL